MGVGETHIVLSCFLLVGLAEICGPRNQVGGCLSPDSIFLHILQNPACVVIIFIYDQVPICVMAGVKVGDHSGGDPQAPHHCRETEKHQCVVDPETISGLPASAKSIHAGTVCADGDS